MTESHEVVVVGGGHNGLVAGCFLARAGLDVVVVEQQDWLGGMAASRPFVPAAPGHVISPGAYENVYLRAAGVARELDLGRYGYRELDAAGWAWFGDDGESLLLQRDVEATVREISRFSRRDASSYRELVEVGVKLLKLQDRYGLDHPQRPRPGTIAYALRTLGGSRRVRALLGSLLTATAADAIESTFESDPVRGIFAGTGTILSPLNVDGSAISMLSSSLLHHHGAARPVGGMGGLITALDRCFRSHGGTVVTGTAVTAVRGGARVEAVELSDGRTLAARRAVIAACPPQLVPDLVGDAFSDPAVAERIRHAPANATGVGTLTVSMALAGRLELPAHQERRTDADLRRPAIFAGTFEDVVDASGDAARGTVPDRTTYCLAIFTAIDPSQAPEGQDVVQLYAPAPVTAVGGPSAWREQAADRLVAKVSKAAPDLCGLELGRFVETSADLAARTGAVNGCIYHVDHLPTRMGPLRPAFGAGGYRTPLPGLYLGSAGCHPGGGVSGLPGRLCAAAVLKDGRSDHQQRRRRTPRPAPAEGPVAEPVAELRSTESVTGLPPVRTRVG
jgi:phytoene dehydrogenase-like protein